MRGLAVLASLSLAAAACGASPDRADAARDAPPDRRDATADRTDAPDAPAVPDAGEEPFDSGVGLNGCAPEAFTDRADGGDERRRIEAVGMTYEPRCVVVRAGQAVVFAGNLRAHPLAPGRSPGRTMDPPGTAPNPIPAVDTGAEARVVFDRAGTFPFYCTYHFAGGMYGVVEVR